MNELYFLGMDIADETKALVEFSTITCTDGMTDVELGAYKMGIANTLSALKAVLDDDAIVVNIAGMEIATELSTYDLENYCVDTY